MKYQEYKRKALEDPAFRKEYEKFDIGFFFKVLWMRVQAFFF